MGGASEVGDRAAFLAWLNGKVGAPYLWGGRGLVLGDGSAAPYEGWDCWGLVACGLYLSGGPDWRGWWTDRAWLELPSVATPAPGDLVFYAPARPTSEQDVNHVEVVLGPGDALVLAAEQPDWLHDDMLPGLRTVAARGGDHRTLTLEIAQKQGARVQYRENHLARPRVAGFRRLPLTTPQHPGAKP